MNSKHPTDFSIPIRLQRQAALPTPRELIDMANECRRAAKRVELPWQPEGRPEPAVLAIEYEGTQHNWTLYSSPKSEAKVIWTLCNAEPTTVVLALRNWFTDARVDEGWGKKDDPLPPLPPSVTKESPLPAPPVSPPASQPAGPGQPYSGQPYMPGGHTYPGTTGYPPTNPPYPQPPAAPPGWGSAYPAQPSYGYPYPGYPGAAVPPHWTQYPQPAASSLPSNQPLAPEQWSLMREQPDRSDTLLLGTLLVAAGVIPTPALQAALTLQNAANVENKRRIGEILVTSGALKTNMLSAAVALQDMVRRGLIPNSKVTDVLRQAHATGASVESLIKATQTPRTSPNQQAALARGDELLEREGQVSDADRDKLKHVMSALKQANLTGAQGNQKAHYVLDLLKTASMINPEVLNHANKTNNHADVLTALVIKEELDPITFEAALGCQRLIDAQHLRVEQAIIALGYCQRMRVPLKEAITDLNWSIPVDALES